MRSYDVTNEQAPLLEVRDLHVEFHTKAGIAEAINGLNFTLEAGETESLSRHRP